MVWNEFIFWLLALVNLLVFIAFSYQSLRFILKRNLTSVKLGLPKLNLSALKIIVLLFYIFTLSGGFIAFNRGEAKDREIRQRLVDAASLVSDGINPRSVPDFTFSEADLENPEYLRFAQQLKITARLFSDYELITLFRKDTSFVTGPSFSKTGQPLEQQPWSRFHDSGHILESIYKGGAFLTHGPYNNGKERVLTGFSAVLTPRSTMPVMVTAINITEAAWKQEVHQARYQPLLLSLVFMLILWAGFIVLSRKSILEFSGITWWKSPEAIFTFVLSIIITGIISYFLINIEREFRGSIFRQMTSVQAAQIRNYMRSFEFRVYQAARGLESSRTFDEQTFKTLAAPLLTNHFVIKVGYMAADTAHRPSKNADIRFMEPSFEYPFGKEQPLPELTFDTKDLVYETCASQLNNFDGPFFMPQSSKEAVCFYYPVNFQDSGKNCGGIFFAVVEPNQMLAEAIAVQGPGKAFFEIVQKNETGGLDGKTIATFHSQHTFSFSKMEMVYPHLFFGRVFGYYFHEGNLFQQIHPPIASTVSPVVGLVLSLLLTFVVGSVTTRKARLEKEVVARTLQLEKSEERYRMISENVGDVIWVYNLASNRFSYLSPSAEKVFGYSLEEGLKMSLKDILTPDSYVLARTRLVERIQAFEQGTNTDRVSTSIFEQIKKDGQLITTEVVTTLLANEQGKVEEILGVTHDITEKVRAQRALEESEEKYRLLVENQQDLIIKVDRDGRYLFASASFYQTFGKSESDIIGKIYMPQIHEEDIEESLKAIADLSVHPYKVYFEQRIKTLEGWKWFSWKNNALFNEQGEIVGFIGVGRDITEKKAYEQMLEESRQKLQEQNEEYAMLNEEYMALNEELRCTNEDLLQAIEKAKESESLKTAFLQNMSHEIRTPLNAVIGFSEMLSLPDLTNEDKTDYAEIIVNSSRQLLNIVNDILTISTLETRQEAISITPLPLNQVMKELESVFQPRALSKNIALRSIIPDDDNELVLETDEMKLKQVLNNLIANAIKFTAKGSVTFGYRRNDNVALFFVEDTGIGIPPDSQEIIFERFRQAKNNDRAIYGGTGLGLAISKGHVELMGGHIWVESEPGKGSKFYFELPLVSS